MRNYVQMPDRIVVAAPAIVTSGAPVMVGGLFGIAQSDAASGADVVLQTTGVVTGTKVGSQAWAVGDRVYWDDGNSRFTTTAADGDLLVGTATAVVASGAGDTTGTVRLSAAQYPVAANVADASAGSAAEINALRDALVAAGLMAAS